MYSIAYQGSRSIDKTCLYGVTRRKMNFVVSQLFGRPEGSSYFQMKLPAASYGVSMVKQHSHRSKVQGQGIRVFELGLDPTTTIMILNDSQLLAVVFFFTNFLATRHALLKRQSSCGDIPNLLRIA